MEKNKNTIIYQETVRILKNSVIYIFGHTAQHYCGLTLISYIN